MNEAVEQGKALMLREHAEQIRAQHPRLSRARAWTLASQQHPELAEVHADSEQETAASQQPAYRYTEKWPTSATSKPLRDKLDEILEERLMRVEA